MTKTFKPIDTRKLEKYFEKGDFSAAKKLVDGFVDQELAPEEKGKIYAEIVSMYLELSNKTNQEYLKQIKETTEALKTLRVEERKDDDEFKKEEIQARLAGQDLSGHDDSDDL